MKEDKLKKVKMQLEELESIEDEFYDEHEELDYIIDTSEIEEATEDVKMQEINKQIDVIAKYYKMTEVGKLRRYIKYSYAEVLEILKYMDKTYIYKLPKQLVTYFENNTLNEYTNHITPKYPLSAQELEPNTKTILALLNIKYWSKDKQKDRLIKLYNINNQKESIE